MPDWVAEALDADVTFAIARVLLTLPYWWSGLFKLFDFHAAVMESAALNLPHPELIAVTTVVVQLVGSLLVVTDRHLWLGAGVLAVFTALATLVAHAFWTLQGAARYEQMNTFLEHVALIAAFATAAIASRRRATHPLLERAT
jgi:uncharacterized membrane protein YphA (DoxX/SURF4 family)